MLKTFIRYDYLDICKTLDNSKVTTFFIQLDQAKIFLNKLLGAVHNLINIIRGDGLGLWVVQRHKVWRREWGGGLKISKNVPAPNR